MSHLAIVTGADAPDLSSDGKRLRAALRDRGHDVDAVRWDRGTDWDRYDVALVRSCWEYYTDPERFRAFVDAVEASAATLLNPPAAIRWNLHKSYLADLGADGLQVVPTAVVPADSDRRLDAVLRDRGWTEAVVKPAVGTSSAGVWKTTREAAADQQTRFESRFPAARKVGDSATGDGDARLSERDRVVQEYVPEVASGELSLVFLGGEFAYAWWSVRADRALDVDPAPDAERTATDPDPAVVDAAADVLTVATDRAGVDPADLPYARVDGVVRDGAFLLLELELIEPFLNLTAGEAVDRFADVVETRLREASA